MIGRAELRQGHGEFGADQGRLQFGFELRDAFAQDLHFGFVRRWLMRFAAGRFEFDGLKRRLQRFDADLIEACILDAEVFASLADSAGPGQRFQQHFQALLGFQ